MELIRLVYQVKMQTLQYSRKLSILLRYCTEISCVYANNIDCAVLVRANVLQSVAACNSEDCGGLNRISGFLSII